VAVAGLATVASGLNATEPGPVLVETIPGQFIAKINADAAGCSLVGQTVQKLQQIMTPNNAAARTVPATASRGGGACYVTFGGDDALKSEVGRMDAVEMVVPDVMGSIYAPLSWGIDRVDEASLPLDGVSPIVTSHTGAGVTLYIADTGVNSAHQDFGGRALRGPDFTTDRTQADGNGHGTHCSGTAAGNQLGIARDANIIGVKVCTDAGRCPSSGVLSGIQWAIDNANGRGGVLSMSLGLGPNALVDDLVDRAVTDHGFIVTVAAGNSNNNACGSSPGSAGGKGTVLTVASSTVNDARSSFSSFGPCTDLFAPGTDITSAWIGSSTAINTISGTSMATPHVAGVAATLLEKYSSLSVLARRKAAQDELLAIAETGRISDTQGTPNLLLQTSRSSAPVSPGNPVEPTVAPTRGPWICPSSWFGASDGCDCECGGGDPDCNDPTQRLYCKGTATDGAICNSNDQCVATSRGVEDILTVPVTVSSLSKPLDTDDAGAEGLTPPVYAAIGGAGVAALAVAGVLITQKMRRDAEPKAHSGSVIAGPDL